MEIVLVAADALTNAILFGLACGLVWWSANRLAARADLLAERTGIGRVFAGALLLGVATSLPEIATSGPV